VDGFPRANKRPSAQAPLGLTSACLAVAIIHAPRHIVFTDGLKRQSRDLHIFFSFLSPLLISLHPHHSSSQLSCQSETDINKLNSTSSSCTQSKPQTCILVPINHGAAVAESTHKVPNVEIAPCTTTGDQHHTNLSFHNQSISKDHQNSQNT